MKPALHPKAGPASQAHSLPLVDVTWSSVHAWLLRLILFCTCPPLCAVADRPGSGVMSDLFFLRPPAGDFFLSGSLILCLALSQIAASIARWYYTPTAPACSGIGTDACPGMLPRRLKKDPYDGAILR